MGRVAGRAQPLWSGTTRGSREPRPCGQRGPHDRPAPFSRCPRPASPRPSLAARRAIVMSALSAFFQSCLPGPHAGRRMMAALAASEAAEPGGRRGSGKGGCRDAEAPDLASRGGAP